jgi:hypothetical protein
MSTTATPMKEVARRKITVTSSFNEKPTGQQGNRMGMSGTRYSTRLHSFLQQAAEQIFKGIFQPFELGGKTILIRSAVKH